MHVVVCSHVEVWWWLVSFKISMISSFTFPSSARLHFLSAGILLLVERLIGRQPIHGLCHPELLLTFVMACSINYFSLCWSNGICVISRFNQNWRSYWKLDSIFWKWDKQSTALGDDFHWSCIREHHWSFIVIKKTRWKNMTCSFACQSQWSDGHKKTWQKELSLWICDPISLAILL